MSILKVNKIQDTTGDDALTFDSSGNTTVNQTLTTTLANITTGGTNNLTISDGNLVIGTNGHGIDFSASEGGSHTGDSILDDYETGTWTPTITGGYTSISYADQKGRYLKVGDLVYAQFRVGFTGTSQGGSYSVGVGPLPFTPSNWTGEQPAGGMLMHSSLDALTGGLAYWPYLTGGDASSFSFNKSDGSGTARAASDVTSNKYIQGQLIYSTGLS